MEKALSSSNTSLSTHFDIDGEIYFPGQSWSLHVDDTNRINFLLVFQIIHNSDQIFGLSWLTDNHYSLVFSDIMLI